MNIYRNQSCPFFYCYPLCGPSACGCGSCQESFAAAPGSAYSPSQWTLIPQGYQAGDSLRWEAGGGEGAGLSPDGVTLSLTPGLDYLVSFLIQGDLPAGSHLQVLPYVGAADPAPYAQSAYSGEGGKTSVSGGLWIPAADTQYLTLQCNTTSPAPLALTGSLHLFPLSR